MIARMTLTGRPEFSNDTEYALYLADQYGLDLSLRKPWFSSTFEMLDLNEDLDGAFYLTDSAKWLAGLAEKMGVDAIIDLIADYNFQHNMLRTKPQLRRDAMLAILGDEDNPVDDSELIDMLGYEFHTGDEHWQMI